MPMRTDVVIRELKLKINKAEFPLKSDLIVGYMFPYMYVCVDEASYDEIHPTAITEEFVGYVVWDVKEKHCVDYSGWIMELESLVERHHGTLIAECQTEGGYPEDHIRIRDGVRKKIKIIEE